MVIGVKMGGEAFETNFLRWCIGRSQQDYHPKTLSER